MTTDENGKKWPETVEEAAQLAEERARADKFFANKAKREGWAKPIHNQGQSNKPKSEQTSAERYFEKKRNREGWN